MAAGRLTCPPKTDPQVKLGLWIEEMQGNEQKALYAATDHWEATGSQSSVICSIDAV
jgi:hypothetical protein